MSTFIGALPTSAGWLAWSYKSAGELGADTPLWTSADGKSWRQLPAATLGATGVVQAIYPVGGRLTALTVNGDKSQCPDTSRPECWETRAPLRAWTSPDGIWWTLSAEPMNLVDVPGSQIPVWPWNAATPERIAVTGLAGWEARLAVSADGVTWQTAQPPEFFADSQVTGMASVSTRFVAVGSHDDPNIGFADFAVWSDDGFTWQPASEFSSTGGGLRVIGTGAAGVVVEGALERRFGWWTSRDGDHWSFDPAFGPLGFPRVGAAFPSGDVAGDGKRLIAYSYEHSKIWQSVDASSWTELTSQGVIPEMLPEPRWMRVLPIGVIIQAGAGAWFGDPGL